MFDTQVACRHVGRNMSGTPWQRSMQNRQPFWAKRINTIGDKEIPYVIYVYMCIDILYIQQDGSNRYQPLASILQCINLMMTRSSPRPAGLAWPNRFWKNCGFSPSLVVDVLDRTFRPPKIHPTLGATHQYVSTVLFRFWRCVLLSIQTRLALVAEDRQPSYCIGRLHSAAMFKDSFHADFGQAKWSKWIH